MSTAQKVRAQLKNLRRKQVVAETKLALLKKKQRNAEAHDKYLLGALSVLAGWETLPIDVADTRIRELSKIIASNDRSAEYREIGNSIFQRSKKNKALMRESRKNTENEWKADVHYRITLGGIWVKYGMATESKAVLLGAMATEYQSIN